jgi:hypothetical protein
MKPISLEILIAGKPRAEFDATLRAILRTMLAYRHFLPTVPMRTVDPDIATHAALIHRRMLKNNVRRNATLRTSAKMGMLKGPISFRILLPASISPQHNLLKKREMVCSYVSYLRKGNN